MTSFRSLTSLDGSNRYAFLLAPEDENTKPDSTTFQQLFTGLKSTTSSHGLSHVSQAKGGYYHYLLKTTMVILN